MSYRRMLQHRCRVERPQDAQVNGLPTISYVVVLTDVVCFLDLGFIRKGKDPMWTPESGRPSDRSGVLFIMANPGIHSGDRITMTKGPTGTFEVQGAVDEAWRPRGEHHVEVGVVEVPSAIAGGGVRG